MKRTMSFLTLMLIVFYFFGQDRSMTDFWNMPASHASEVLALNNMNIESQPAEDGKQKLDSIVAYNALGTAWVKNTFTYGDNENVVQSIFMFITTGEREKTEYIYDGNGWLISYVLYDWNSYLGIWQEVEKTDFTYNASGKLILEMFYEWDDNLEQWGQSSKSEYTYDNEEKLLLRMEWSWLNEWVEDWKSEYSYDANGNLIEQIDYDRWPSIWVKTWKHEYQYDPDDQLVIEFDYEWESSGMLWLPVYRQEYTWDNQGNLSYDITYNWDEAGSVWENSGKSEYTYDTTYSSPELVMPFTYDEFPFEFNHMVTEQYHFSWNASSSSWELFYSTVFYYSDYIPGYIDEPVLLHFQLYPNPANEQINISVEGYAIDEVVIYALTGQQILRTGIEGNGIDISGIPAGIYIVEIVVDGRMVREKLVVE